MNRIKIIMTFLGLALLASLSLGGPGTTAYVTLINNSSLDLTLANGGQLCMENSTWDGADLPANGGQYGPMELISEGGQEGWENCTNTTSHINIIAKHVYAPGSTPANRHIECIVYISGGQNYISCLPDTNSLFYATSVPASDSNWFPASTASNPIVITIQNSP